MSYTKVNATRIVRTLHMVKIFDYMCAGEIREDLERVPASAKLYRMDTDVDGTTFILEFLEEHPLVDGAGG